MVKNPGNDPAFLDGSDDFQFASAVRAVFDVDRDILETGD